MKLSVKDVAKLLNKDESTIYGWIRQGKIPVHRINEQSRFNREEILEWATSQQIAVSPEVAVVSDEGTPALPSLGEALETGGVFSHMGGADKAAVLRNVVNAMRLPEEVDRDFLYQVLLAREALGSTGIGDGIAIPHIRNPIVMHLEKPVIMLCFLDSPIEFGAVNGKPVDILFTMVSPTVRMHLHLLSRLGFVLQNTAFRAALKNRLPCAPLLEELARAERALPSVGPNRKREE